VATTRPSGAVITAASSPGPTSTVAEVPEPGHDPVDEAELAHRACGSVRHSASLQKGPSVPVQAYILIQTEVGKAAAVADAISALDGVAQAEDVTGRTT
jgi:hypothetical protein